ncbi:hypothetical protein ACJX0J_005611, partial [Zea mays]
GKLVHIVVVGSGHTTSSLPQTSLSNSWSKIWRFKFILKNWYTREAKFVLGIYTHGCSWFLHLEQRTFGRGMQQVCTFVFFFSRIGLMSESPLQSFFFQKPQVVSLFDVSILNLDKSVAPSVLLILDVKKENIDLEDGFTTGAQLTDEAVREAINNQTVLLHIVLHEMNVFTKGTTW